MQFKHLYHIDSYPSVAIIDPRTGTCSQKAVLWWAGSVVLGCCTQNGSSGPGARQGIICSFLLGLGEKMISLSASSADSFLQEVSEFLANNPYEEEGQGDQQHMVSVPYPE